MVVIMKASADQQAIDKVTKLAQDKGLKTNVVRGNERVVIGLIGDERPFDPRAFELLDGVDRAMRVLKPYKLVSIETSPEPSLIPIGVNKAGGNDVLVIAGPCSVESREQIIDTAVAVKSAGAIALRGGAYKPRSSPYSFQGMGVDGLKLLAEARDKTGLPVVTEIMSEKELDVVADYADVLQVGARNMQNFTLLRAIGKLRKTVLLKRGMSATIDELLMSAEYILSGGNPNVILCERGIRTFETATRNTFDINAIPVLKKRTHLPVFADPSHATGHWDLVVPTARAAVAAGADGIIVEVHPNPAAAVSDGAQSLLPEKFEQMMTELRPIATAIGRRIA